MTELVIRRIFTLPIVTALLLMGGCAHKSASGGAAAQAPQALNNPGAEQQQSQPTPNPEIETQKQQVSVAQTKAESALKGIYSYKRKGQAVITTALKQYLDDDYERSQSTFDLQGAAVIREQNRWKDDLAKRRSELRKLESSPYSEVQAAAKAASQKIDGEVKRFEKGLPPVQ